jgi:peptidoglycan/LPS O-acetylase OafA/YrhL
VYLIVSIIALTLERWLDLGTGAAVWPYLTFTSNLSVAFHQAGILQAVSGHPFLAHTWSVAIEFQFYLLIPIAVFVLDRRQLQAVLIGILILSPAARILINGQLGAGSSYFITITRLDGLALGALFATAIDGRQTIRRRTADAIAWLSAAVVIFALALWVSGFTDFSKPLFNLFGVTVIDAAAALMVASAVLRPDGWFSKVLQTRGLVRLGEISYSVYMLHYPIGLLAIDLLAKAGSISGWSLTLAIAGFSIAGTLALATISWWGLEARIMRLKQTI